MSSRPQYFDRDVSLAESLAVVPRPQLERSLTKSLGHHWQIVDTDGTPILGPGLQPESSVTALPLRADIEVVGQLQGSNVLHDQLEVAAQWLELVLMTACRYRMAADLHIEASHSDFEALQRQHAALQQSEARYRELAEELDRRVQSQIAVIELRQRQVYQSEKMASVGSLAAGVAHEINNPIGFIRSNLSTAARYVEAFSNVLAPACENSPVRMPASSNKADIDFMLDDFPALLSESITGADRIARIVANLKAFANVDCASDGKVNMNDVIRAATAVIGDHLPETIVVELALQPVPIISCDQSRMNQVLFSMIQNAHQALGQEGGRIRIASQTSGDEIQIRISDDGCGIQPELLARIYDPFFTTRDVGQGTGLGLTVSRDIVMAHSGRIEVRSEPGVGSTFMICLPCAGGYGEPQKERAN